MQVEGIPTAEAITRLTRGVQLPDFYTLACKVQLLEPAPLYPARVPPIRERKSIPTSWLAMKLVEGKNRQVRRMTAAVGYPTLRLIRAAMGRLELARLDLEPGKWQELTEGQIKLLLA
nr:hypothetical protein [Verrucomicrobium spinosum]